MASNVALRDTTPTGPASPRAIQYLALALSVALAMLLAVFNDGGVIERSLLTVRDTINSKQASGEVHLVEIDAKSLSALNRWPWPRSNHAQLIDRLNEAGIQQIVFDVDFSAPSTDAEDQALAAAISRAKGKISLPTFRQPASTSSDKEIENLPLAILRRDVFLGSVNVHPDNAGQVNRYPFGTVTAGTPRPSLGAILANASGPVAKDFRIDQSIELTTIPRHSFVDILQGRFDKGALKDKKIIIGATAIEIGDRYATARFGVIPGVLIQALAAETLIAGSVIPDCGPWPMLFLALAGVVISFRSFGDQRLVGGTSALVIAVSIFIFALMAERHRLAHFEIAPALLLVLCALAAHYVVGMFQSITKERRFDQESGLPNLVSWQSQKCTAEQCVVIVAEIVNFGSILSTLCEKDAVLFFRAISDRLELASGRGLLYRIGREHFCWKPETDDKEQAESLLESTAHLFNAPLQINGRSIRATLCFGAAKGRMNDWAALANKATLAAKHAGEMGERFVWHDDSLAHDTDQSLLIISEFDEALMTGQISVVYQPKFSLAHQRVTGAEALVRWHHPSRGTISPAIFVPVLERENLMEPLTLFVLRQAVDDMAQWNAFGQPIGCAVNISASLLVNSAFVDRAIAIVSRSDVDPKLVTFELTETAALSSLERAASTLDRFKQLGIRLSIDDYGTGQSTLSYLKRFSADEIKIDQSFVKLVATDNANRIMVRSTTEMAHALGLSVVAEGVEDSAAMDILREIGCDVIQGWFIGKPVTKEQFIQCWQSDPYHSRVDTPALSVNLA